MKIYLIVCTIICAVSILLILGLTAAWLHAEFKLYKLTGNSKWFRSPENKKRKGDNK